MQDLKAGFQGSTSEEQCLRDLFITDPISDREGIITSKGRRTPGTCEWILQRDEYHAWSTAQSGLLWVSGPPGKGKTFISVFLSQVLEVSKPDALVISFFCSNQIPSRNTATNVLRGLMTQLIQKHNQLISYVEEVWKHQGSGLFESHSFESLWRIFMKMLQALEETEIFCVLDALDECDIPSLSALLFKMKSLFAPEEQHRPRRQLKVVVASREHPEALPTVLSGFTRIQIGALDQDLQRYISDRVSRLAKAKDIEKSKLCRYIEKAFGERAGGTFLWVSLMAQDLEQTPVHAMERVLGQLPHGLYAVYERILAQIDFTDRSAVIKMLTWLLHAERPLALIELCPALDIKPTEHLSKEEVCVGYIQACGHLLAIDARVPWDLPIDSSNASEGPKFRGIPYPYVRVSFVHQSVRDFLSGLVPTITELHLATADRRMAHIMITNRLIRCLSMKSLPADFFDASAHAPLVFYATKSWAYHFSQLESDCTVVVNANKDFFQEHSPFRDRWWRWNEQRPPYLNENDVPILYVAAEKGLYHLARLYLQKRNTLFGWRRKKEVNRTWCYGRTPLHMLSRGPITTRRLALAKLLLDYGASAAALDSDKISPLHLSAEYAREDRRLFDMLVSTKPAQRLISKEIHSEQARSRRNLLDYAAYSENAGLCQEIIEKYGYDPNERGKQIDSALYQALQGCSIEVAKVFADHWDPRATESSMEFLEVFLDPYWTAEDIGKGLDLITQVLRIDINSVDENGNTAFHRAPSLDVSIVDAFIKRGFDLNKRNVQGCTILHTFFQSSPCILGSRSKQETLYPVLKESELDINSKDGLGRTPLHAVVDLFHSNPIYAPDEILGFDEISEFDVILEPNEILALLDFGADRSLKDTQGITATELAIQYHTQLTDASQAPEDYDLIHLHGRKKLFGDVIDILLNYSTVPINPRWPG